MYNKSYYAYFLTNRHNTTFYIGITNNISKRVEEHRSKAVQGFTARYNLEKLVYYEVFHDVGFAIKREKQLKNWHRNWKLKLITDSNPTFRDLTEELQ